VIDCLYLYPYLTTKKIFSQRQKNCHMENFSFINERKDEKY